MLARIALASAVVVAGAIPALAAPPIGLLLLLAPSECVRSDALVTQCLFQTVEGDRNTAIIKQKIVHSGDRREWQIAVTVQDGNDNSSYTEQRSSTGADQLAVTVQKGNDNHAYTYQEGEDQISATVQVGDGHWAATSVVGEGPTTVILQSN
jgi:hypothetical protein